MSAPTNKSYSNFAMFYYRLNRLIFLNALIISNVLIFCALAIFAAHYSDARSISSEIAPIIATVCFGFGGLGAFAAWWAYFRKSRPIGISDHGAASFLPYGKMWKTICWGKVVTIEMLRNFDPLYSTYYLLYTVSDGSTKIRFESTIIGIDRLLELINEKIAAHAIRLVYVDKGIDTRRRLSGSMSSLERRKLLRQGLVRTVTKLVSDPSQGVP
jgi:hypothetical protein